MSSEAPTGWKLRTVGELTINLNRHRVPLSGTERSHRQGPYPYWGANGPIDSLDDYRFEGPHILLAEDGYTVAKKDGRATVHWTDGCFWVNNHAHVLRAAPGVNLRWLFHALANVDVGAYVTGSAQPKISQGNLNAIRIMTPPSAEQDEIASVLEALDKKLASNDAVAQTLVETVATAYAARFVDFLGVEREVDRLPSGWSAGNLADIAEPTKQSVQPSSRPDDVFEHFSIPAYDKGEGPDLVLGASMLSDKTALPDGDCVLVATLKPATKRVWWPRPTGEGQAVCSPEFLALVPRAGFPNSYLYALASRDGRFYNDLLSHATGTTGSRQRVKQADAMSCQVLVPPSDVLDEWHAFAGPLYEHAQTLRLENVRLRRVQAALVPRLLSGDLRVSTASDTERVSAAPQLATS